MTQAASIFDILADAGYMAGTERPPFLTGSRAYGTPHEKSDFDFVVMGKANDFLALHGFTLGSFYDSGNSINFGCINFLVCETQAQYDCWKEGTDALNAIAPVTRDDAMKLFAAMRKQRGL